MYRKMLREVYKVKDKTHRDQLLQYVRAEFEINKHHTEEVGGCQINDLFILIRLRELCFRGINNSIIPCSEFLISYSFSHLLIDLKKRSCQIFCDQQTPH